MRVLLGRRLSAACRLPPGSRSSLVLFSSLSLVQPLVFGNERLQASWLPPYPRHLVFVSELAALVVVVVERLSEQKGGWCVDVHSATARPPCNSGRIHSRERQARAERGESKRTLLPSSPRVPTRKQCEYLTSLCALVCALCRRCEIGMQDTIQCVYWAGGDPGILSLRRITS